MIIIFLGPPYSGKGTQSELLGEHLGIPVFSMGALIRKAYKEGDPNAVEGFEQYSMKGLHLPNRLKFPLLKKELDSNKPNLIIDNYPATKEDLDTFLDYMSQNILEVDYVFYINISAEEMKKRMVKKRRSDDTAEILLKRRQQQDADRVPVIEYFKSSGKLTEINGEARIEDIQTAILEVIK
jgi:adenylate kinase